MRKRYSVNRKNVFILFLFLLFFRDSQLHSQDTETIPVPGMVTLVDLGSTTCVPCMMMEPVLDELTTEYRNRVAIIFIDVQKNPEKARPFYIRVIPTQIFFDIKGNEITRHEGFLDKETIAAVFMKLGVKKK